MARPASGVVPPLSAFPALFASVSKQYEAALQSGAAFFYPSRIIVARQSIKPGEPSSQEAGDASSTSAVPWTIRCVPAILDKAREKHRRAQERDERGDSNTNAAPQAQDSGARQNPDDVFAPPYHPGLLIKELPRHTILLNKFCVVPKHFLLVSRDFEPQSMPPSPEALSIAYRMLHAHRSLSQQGNSSDVTPGKELLAFYNCGEDSGASQAHQHMQFAELGDETDEAPSASADGSRSAIAKESLLDLIHQDGREQEQVHALPLPYQHFVVLLGQAPIEDDDRLTEFLGNKLMILLDALFEARANAAASQSGDRGGRRATSWNLLMTTRAMHLIPRSRENFAGLKEMVNASANGSGRNEHAAAIDGQTHDSDGLELVGELSVNSLGYAGHLLVKSEQELELLRRYPGGVVDVLRQTGVAPVPNFTAAAEGA